MKYLNQLYRSLILIITLIILNSCSEFLEQLPQDQYTSDLLYQTEEDMTLAVNALYDFLPVLDQRYSDPRLWLWTDDGWRRNGGREGADLNWLASDGFLDFYKYNEIRQCNEVIARIPEADITSVETANRLEAEARFIRAMLYERMVFLHGGVPLVTEPQTVGFQPSRNERLDVFNFVISELQSAANNLPDSYGASDMGRVTKWAALALLARANLNAIGWHPSPNQLYDNAEAACREIINSGMFSLDDGIDGFRSLFMPDSDYQNGGSSAVILARVYIEGQLWYEEMAYKCLPRGSFRGIGDGAGNNQAQFGATWNLVRAFQTINGLDPANDANYDESDPFTDRDPRLRASLILPGDSLQVRGGEGQSYYTFQPHPDGDGSRDDNASRGTGIDTGYLIRKYAGLNLNDNATQTFESARRGHTDYKIIRYAEVLLMLAECLAADNNAEAFTYINMVRERAGMPAYNGLGDVPLTLRNGTTGNDMIDAVLLERRYEFAGEATQRMSDIWRYQLGDQVYGEVLGMPEDVDAPGSLAGPYTSFAQTTRVWDDKNYLLPIPQSALDVNPNLDNNPGW